VLGQTKNCLGNEKGTPSNRKSRIRTRVFLIIKRNAGITAAKIDKSLVSLYRVALAIMKCDHIMPCDCVNCVTSDTPYFPSFDQEDDSFESGDAKFLITSTWTLCFSRRNRIPHLPPKTLVYKPSCLAHLEDALFMNFVIDLQSTLQYRSVWTLLFWLPFCSWAATTALFLTIWGDDHDYSVIVLIDAALICMIFGKILYRFRLLNIEYEINERVKEWSPMFEQQGFAINYVIDDPNWMYVPKETYVHIYRTTKRPQVEEYVSHDSLESTSTPTPSFDLNNSIITKEISRYEKEDAKFLLFYPMELCRRNVDARRIGCDFITTAPTCHVKPPSLRNLDDAVFAAVLRDIEIATAPSFVFRFVFFIGIFSLFMINFAFSMSVDDDEYHYEGSLISFSLLLLLHVLDRWIRLYFNCYALSSDIARNVETKWRPLLNAVGFTMLYHVDRPQCWSTREEYVHIRKLKIVSDPAQSPGTYF
jgi:hypothetical protein